MAAVLAWLALFLALGAVGMALANRGLEPGLARRRWFKYATYLVVIAIEVGLAASGLLVLLALPVALVGAWELARVLPGSRSRALPWLVGLPYSGLAAGLLLFALRLPTILQVAVALQVLVFDGFSQVTGQLLGRHALVPRLSPAKTREGLFGGLVACLTLLWFVKPLETGSDRFIEARSGQLGHDGGEPASDLPWSPSPPPASCCCGRPSTGSVRLWKAPSCCWMISPSAWSTC